MKAKNFLQPTPDCDNRLDFVLASDLQESIEELRTYIQGMEGPVSALLANKAGANKLKRHIKHCYEELEQMERILSQYTFWTRVSLIKGLGKDLPSNAVLVVDADDVDDTDTNV